MSRFYVYVRRFYAVRMPDGKYRVVEAVSHADCRRHVGRGAKIRKTDLTAPLPMLNEDLRRQIFEEADRKRSIVKPGTDIP